MNATALETAQAAATQSGHHWRTRVLPWEIVSARVLDAVLATAVFVVGMAVYCATLAPGLTYVSLDGNELATVPHQLGLAHSPGYPFYTWIGKLFTYLPVGDVAYRMNLMSAVGAAGTAALLYGIIVLLTRSRAAAVFAALLFSFSSALWSQAVITEVYAPNVFMMALTLFLFLSWGERLRHHEPTAVRDRRATILFGAACLSFGLSLGTHISNLALVPGLVIYVFLASGGTSVSAKTFLLGGGLFLLGACQFLWLPLRAGTLNDELMIRHAPDNWRSVFDYMFNVFDVSWFGFPLSALPERIHVYAELVGDNFGLWGVGFAMIGIWDMLYRRKKAFYLLGLTYLVEVVYFTQYNVPDIDVFFIPAHLAFVVFIAFGVRWVIDAAARLGRRSGRWTVPVRGCLAVCLVFPVAFQLHANWTRNDHSSDTTIEDFYTHAFQALPQNSVLVGHSGVPGFDIFYYHLARGWRPDVLVPQEEQPDSLRAEDMAGRPIYTTAPDVIDTGPRPEGTGSGPDALWYVPVLAAPSVHVSWLGGHPLILYQAQAEPPLLVVRTATPQYQVGEVMDRVEFVGFDLDRTEVAAGGTLHVRLYWRPLEAPVLNYYRVSTVLGDDLYRETHTLGFDLLRRYQREDRFRPGDVIVEDYDLVVMSSLPAGEHMLRLGTCDFGSFGSRTEEWLDLTEIRVVD